MIRGVAVASFLPTTASNVPQIVDRAVRRVNVHKTSASPPSSVRRMMDNLNVDTQGDRHPIWSLWCRCVACGWRHGNHVATSSRRRRLVCASPLQESNQSLNHAPGAPRNARPTHDYRRCHPLPALDSRLRHRHLRTRPQCDGCDVVACPA